LTIDKELIVVDGRSTDGSVEILKNYATVLVSEKDSSAYEAWNKAIALASGDWILFLNSDDSIISENIELILRKVPDNHTGIVQFGVTIADVSKTKMKARFPKLSFSEIISEPCFFNGYIFHRKVFETVGFFNEEFVRCADQEFLWRCLLNKVPVVTFKIKGYSYLIHEGSLTLHTSENFFSEEVAIAERVLNSSKSRSEVSLAKRWANWESTSNLHKNKFVRVGLRFLYYKTSRQQLYSMTRKITRLLTSN
jgi:glycosyltransferase involved in cell wall biosynthesis